MLTSRIENLMMSMEFKIIFKNKLQIELDVFFLYENQATKIILNTLKNIYKSLSNIL